MTRNAIVPELLVSDHATSLGFYTRVLGFREVYGRPEEGFSLLERHGAELMLDQRVPGSPRDWVAADLQYPYGRGINLEIEVPDCDALLRSCEQAGAPIFLPMEEKWYRGGNADIGVRQFIVLDPDGYMLRFSQSIGTRPAG